MNNKGFTLIELLATVTILAILAGVSTTIYLNTYTKHKEEINKIEEDNIKKAAANIVATLDDCDDEIDEDLLKSLRLSNCQGYFEKIESSQGLRINISNLQQLKYMDGIDLSKYEKKYVLIKVADGKPSYEIKKMQTASSSVDYGQGQPATEIIKEKQTVSYTDQEGSPATETINE